MGEKVFVNVIRVEYICDKCGEGKMVPTGKVLDSNPPQIEHKCDKCGDIMYSTNSYPLTKFECKC